MRRNTAANPVGRPLVGPWLEENLPVLAARFRGTGDLSSLLESMIPFVGLVRPAATRAHFRAHPFPEGAWGVANGLEELDLLERLGRRWGG